MSEDVTIIPATETWVGQGDLAQSGLVIVGLTLATGQKAAVGLTPDQAQAFIDLVRREIMEARFRGSGRVAPLYRV
jgi:hypothetical protein